MKKSIALLLALVMVCSLATVAFAAEGEEEQPAPPTADKTVTVNATETTSFKFIKKYVKAEGSTELAAAYPVETLKFEVSGNADGKPVVTMEDHTVGSNPDEIVLTVDNSCNVPGKYDYTITEKAGSTQGVKYDTNTVLKVSVYIYWDEVKDESTGEITSRTLKKAVTLTKAGTADKADTIVNTYELGTLTVKKLVEGNLASHDAEFTIDVTFSTAKDKAVASTISYSGGSLSGTLEIAASEWTDTDNDGIATVTKPITVKHDGTVTFTNVPAGVTYTIAENEKHLLENGGTVDPNSEPDTQYNVSYSDSSTGEVDANAQDDVVVTNTKSTSVETGIALDSMPYILILAVAACGLVLFTTRKRIRE